MWTVARQAPQPMGFSRKEPWSGLHALLQGFLPTQGPNLCLRPTASAEGSSPLVPLEMATRSSVLAWKICGQRSLAGYNPWGSRESNVTERLKPPSPLEKLITSYRKTPKNFWPTPYLSPRKHGGLDEVKSLCKPLDLVRGRLSRVVAKED